MKRILVIFALFVLPVMAIVGGKPQKRDGNADYHVAIILARVNNFGCSGALYEDYFVLTAASCVKNLKPEDLLVLANTTTLDLNLDGKYAAVYKVDLIIAKDVSGKDDVRNNLALLRLTTFIRPSKHMMPVRLTDPWGRDDDKKQETGAYCQFTGWGQNEVSKSFFLLIWQLIS